VIQARLSGEGHLACVNGYVQGETSPEQQAADLEAGLAEAGIPGPFVLASSVDGVHAARLFADGRDDIAGMVLVDPMSVGFPAFYDDLLPDFGHPPWLDLAADVSASLDDLSDIPLVVIEQDPDAVFLSTGFLQSPFREASEQVNDFWQEGLAFYTSLSSDTRSVVATGTGLDMVIWAEPDLVIEEIISVLGE
jgi:pimeloyl-ACP methyl ester carboxylesterase